MTFLDDFFDVLLKPAAGFKRLAEGKSIYAGLLIYLSVVIISNLSSINTVHPGEIARDMEQMGLVLPASFIGSLPQVLPFLSIITVLTFGPAFFLGRTALVSLSAVLLKGEGDVRSLGLVFGYAQLPYILIAPASLLSRVVNFEFLGLVSAAIFIWVIVLRVIALRSVYNLSTGRSILAVFLPFLVVLFSLLFFFLFMGAFMSPLLAELFI